MPKLGSSLGTIDQMRTNNYLARQMLGGANGSDLDKLLYLLGGANGSDLDKLLYLLGGATGNAMRVNREGRENKKIDNIINQAKEAPVTYNGDSIGVSALSPEQSQAYNQQIADLYNMAATPNQNAISVGVTNQPYTVPSDIPLNVGSVQAVATPTNNGMNNYNLDYIKQQARKQGISDRVLNSRLPDIQNDIVKQAEALYLPEIRRNLYGYKDTEGKFIEPTTNSRLLAMEQLDELSKYSPDTAKAYQALAVNGLQGDVNFQQRKELAQIQAANQRDSAQLRANAALEKKNRITRKQETTTPKATKPAKISMSDYKSAVEGMNGLIETYGKDKIKADPVLLEQYTTFAIVANAYRKQVSGTSTQQTKQQSAKQPQQPTTSVADQVRELASQIDYGDFDSLNQNGMAMIEKMQGAGSSYADAMEAMGKLLYPKVKSGELDAGDYRAFMGDYKPQMEIDDDALQNTLNWNGQGTENTVGTLDDVLDWIQGKVKDTNRKRGIN